MKVVFLLYICGMQTKEDLLGSCCFRKVSERVILWCITIIKRIIAEMTANSAYEPSGSWDSIHVFEIAERGRQAHYKLTSTVMLQLTTRQGPDGGEGDKNNEKEDKDKDKDKKSEGRKQEGEVNLSGSMTRQVCNIIIIRNSSLFTLILALA